ncbi:MAG: hypothetical protein ACK40R_04350, partial [Thermomonas sp.]
MPSVSLRRTPLAIATLCAVAGLTLAACKPAEAPKAATAPQAAAAIAQHGSRVRVVLTIGAVGLSPTQIDALPALTLICAL